MALIKWDPFREFNALTERGIRFSILDVGDAIQNLFLLIRCTFQVNLFIAIRTNAIQPEDSSSQLSLVLLVFAGHQIDELRRPRFHRASRMIVWRNDRLAEGL